MQNPNKPIWFNEDTYQTIQQSNTRTEVIDLSEPLIDRLGKLWFAHLYTVSVLFITHKHY